MRSARPVKRLPDEVARKIAAGEVIDRPAAVVRELIDNAIDADAKSIAVEIANGGIDRIRVADDGRGMSEADLSICADAHTTSKIAAEDDLLKLETLGFRGEALSSIRAVSDLEITTTQNGREAWKLAFGAIKPDRLPAGTVVLIENLFGNFPARRQFLKRAAAETSQCRQVFTEKALAWPAISFRLLVDEKPRLSLPAAASLRERALAALEPKEGANFFYELSGSGNGFSFALVVGSPDVVRADRRETMVFVNGRRVSEYSLVQAIEYGCEGHFPNGGHPFALLFVTIDASLVDFNIHPAKKEIRFRDIGSVHRAVSSTLRDFYRRYSIATIARSESLEDRELDYGLDGASRRSRENEASAHDPKLDGYGGGRATPSAFDRPPERALPRNETRYVMDSVPDLAKAAGEATRGQTAENSGNAGFAYHGQVFGTFLAVEKGDRLYLIDQHAAHERILFDELLSRSGERQELLVPYRVETVGEDENANIENAREALGEAGFAVEGDGDGLWLVTAVPDRWVGTERDLIDDLKDSTKDPRALVSHLYATIACRGACKAGDALDAETARALAERALALPEPVCPHGRPIWIEIDRAELFERIKRT